MQASDDSEPGSRGPAPALGLGERLRSARKAKALSVQQVAEALHLEESSVVALEEGRFEAMGAPVFVRGHLRRYAQLVGLSPDTVLEAYRVAAPQSDAPPSLARRREPADTVRIGPWVWWIAAAVILLVAIIALSNGGDEEPAAPAVEAPPAGMSPPSPAPEVTPPAGLATPPVTPGAPPLPAPETSAVPQAPDAGAPATAAPAAPAGN